jgi:peptidoglycan/LPS O-acetylase OafA/YrhL
MADSERNGQSRAAGGKTVDEDTAAARDREMLHEGMVATARSMAGPVVLGAVALVLALYFLKHPYLASDQILKGKGEDWYEAHMPNVLLAMLGAVLGVFAGWRISSSGGMMGWPGWIVAAIGVAVLCVVGVIGAVIIYPSPIPLQVWVGLAAAALTMLVLHR